MATSSSYFERNLNMKKLNLDYGKERKFMEQFSYHAEGMKKKLLGVKSEFLRSHLNVSGSKALSGSKYLDVLSDIKKGGHFTGFGLMMEAGMTAFGMNYRLKEGQSFLPALGKELAENAIYGLAPMLGVGLIGKAVVGAYPQLNMMAKQKKSMQNNYNILGGNYLDTQTNLQSRARAMQHIKRSRASIANGLGGEARRFHR